VTESARSDLFDLQSTGFLPHLTRLARELATTRGAKGLIREARGIGTHILHYPFGWTRARVRPSDNGSSPDGRPVKVDRIHDTPVALVHGYFHNRSGFDFLSQELRRRGFRWIHGMNYNPLGNTIPELAERFGRYVDDLRRVSGSNRVHIVGHSLGGVIARWYVEELGGHRVVDTCVTIGTPHRGTYAAYLGPGVAARELRPGSGVMQRLESSLRRSRVKYVNLYSDLDLLIIPPSSALLPDQRNVHNHLVEDLGHTSLLLSDELVDQLCHHLEKIEQVAKLPKLIA
jgi:triacylglycerol esterase/lipase EstA (alpha/beta hydrolase family)